MFISLITTLYLVSKFLNKISPSKPVFKMCDKNWTYTAKYRKKLSFFVSKTSMKKMFRTDVRWVSFYFQIKEDFTCTSVGICKICTEFNEIIKKKNHIEIRDLRIKIK